MGVIKVDEIMGYLVGQGCVCRECATKVEEEVLSQYCIITVGDIERGDELYFCDRCEKQLGQLQKLLSRQGERL